MVVAGGHEKTTDLYTLGSSNPTWKKGPALPTSILGAVGLELDKHRFLLIGGEAASKTKSESSKAIFQFECRSRVCSWTKLVPELSFGRKDALAFLVNHTDYSDQCR